jgi:hypothetical protein
MLDAISLVRTPRGRGRHPDGSGVYGEAVRSAPPGAVQVSDRWHLWHGLAEATWKDVEAPRPATSARTSPPARYARRGGRPGNGHQSGHGLDVAAMALTREPASRVGQSPVAWGEYEPAIRRWEGLLRFPAPPPAEPGPSGRPRLSAAFAEGMMGLYLGVRCPVSASVQVMTCSLWPSCA